MIDIESADVSQYTRKILQRGYDIIHDRFFVEEAIMSIEEENNIQKVTWHYFNDFDEYYRFLDGDIYSENCYYSYKFSQEHIDKYSLDLSKINTECFIDYTIKSIPLKKGQDRAEQYNKSEKLRQEHKRLKQEHKRWIAKFNSCTSYKEFESLIKRLRKSKSSKYEELYITRFIHDNPEKSFNILIEFVSNGYEEYGYRDKLCILYNPKDVLEHFSYKAGVKATNIKHNKQMKELIEGLSDAQISKRTGSYFDFDDNLFIYIENIRIVSGNNTKYLTIKLAFCEFEELASYLNNDLSYCNLFDAVDIIVDTSKYRVGRGTVLPKCQQNDLIYTISKTYDKIDEIFIVDESWRTPDNIIVEHRIKEFEFFFDFIHFLENDLSNAILFECKGIAKISDLSSIDFTDAKLHSTVLDRLGVEYPKITFSTAIDYFNGVEKNEENTSLVLANTHIISEDIDATFELNCDKIYYITDLHILHHIVDKCQSENDVCCELLEIVHRLNGSNTILIGGDICSDFNVFSKFIQLLDKKFNTRYSKVKIIFVLGNHDLWPFNGKQFNDIVDTYRNLLYKYGIYLLQNDILYIDYKNDAFLISEETLSKMSKDELRSAVKSARKIIFGGLGFSGKNEDFNANSGIYLNVINREQDIQESEKFNRLYRFVCESLPDRPVIILSHTPQKDWCSTDQVQPGFIYVNGHTHSNFYYDDGDSRIYSDNQIGYRGAINLKYFYIDTEYDTLADYSDGIHIITREQYIDFYRGKKIKMSFNLDIKIYLIKKNGYYMFLYQNKNGRLGLLCGGSRRSLPRREIEYYYENIDKVISKILTPLSKFTDIQKRVSKFIKEIGGNGRIHGAIVDIDYYNHIYINPNDCICIPYFAESIVYKIMYPSLIMLLKERCPSIYSNYIRLGLMKNICDDANFKAIKVSTDLISPELYLETDMYIASGILKKMQRLHSNILGIWPELE